MLPSLSSCHFTPQAPFDPRLRQMLGKTFSMSPNNHHIGSGRVIGCCGVSENHANETVFTVHSRRRLNRMFLGHCLLWFFSETGVRLKSRVMAWRRIRWFVVLEIGITRLMTKKEFCYFVDSHVPEHAELFSSNSPQKPQSP